MKLFWIIVSIIVFQRIVELLIARRNESTRKKEGAVEYDRKGYEVIVAMHAAFFISLVLEYIFLKRTLNTYWAVFISVFILAQILRYWSIASLGKYWNTKILVKPDTPLIRKGPYRYIKHPNYLSVVIEIAVIPLIFSCYLTSAIFTITNLALLSRRIKIEERALLTASRSDYKGC